MSITEKMLAPGSQAGINFTLPSGNSYTSDANGVLSGVTPGDVASLIQAGCVAMVINPVNAVSSGSSTATLNAYGVNTINGPSSAGTYTIAGAAIAGVKVVINLLAAGSTQTKVVTTSPSSTVTFDGTNNTATFVAAGGTLVLESISTSKYCITSNVGSVSLSSV